MRRSLFDSLKPQRQFIHDLSENATMGHLIKSLKSYTDDMYELINKQLFDIGEIHDEPLKTIAHDIDTVFDLVPALEFDIKVYKGIKYKFVAGIYPGYSSTTEELDVAYKFSSYDSSDDPYLLQIIIPKKFKVIPLEEISANKGEFELLLPSFTTFRIDGISQLSNKKPIIMASCLPTPEIEKKKYQDQLKQSSFIDVDEEDDKILDLLYNYSMEAIKDFDLSVEDAIDITSQELEDKISTSISDTMKRRVQEKLILVLSQK